MNFTIELAETDSFIHEDGKARLVNVIIRLENKKVFRFPYPAGNEISSLYREAERLIAGERGMTPVADVPSLGTIAYEIRRETDIKLDKQILDAAFSNEIERRDIVRFIGLPDSVDKSLTSLSEELEVGKEYRVLAITKQNNIVTSYDIQDDDSPNKIRLTVPVFTVKLVRKAEKILPKSFPGFELLFKCECGDEGIILAAIHI